MADEAEKPAFDPSELLGKLGGIVTKNQDPKEGGGKSWVSTLIIIAVVLVGLAVWSWISFRSNRELAKLRHEKETQRILAEKAVVDAKVAEFDAVAKAAQETRARAAEQQRLLETQIKVEEERYAANLRAIDRIRSWNDVPDPR